MARSRGLGDVYKRQAHHGDIPYINTYQSPRAEATDAKAEALAYVKHHLTNKPA
jgi:hypothetical protein